MTRPEGPPSTPRTVPAPFTIRAPAPTGGADLALSFARTLDAERTKAPDASKDAPEPDASRKDGIAEPRAAASRGKPSARPGSTAAGTGAVGADARFSAAAKANSEIRNAAVVDVTRIAVQEQSAPAADPGDQATVASPPERNAAGEPSARNDGNGTRGGRTASADAPAGAESPQAHEASNAGSPPPSSNQARPSNPTSAAPSPADGPGAARGAGQSRPTAQTRDSRGPTRVGPIPLATGTPGGRGTSAPEGESKAEPVALKPAAAGVKLVGPALAGAASKLRERRAPHAPRAAKHAEDSPPRGLASQMERGFAAALRQGGGSVTIRLEPESLGSLRIRVVFEDGKVSARFQAADDAAQKLLNDELPALRRALESRGLAVERLDVDAPAAREARREGERHRPEAGQDRSASGGAGEGGHGGHGRGRDSPWGGGAAPGREAWEQAPPEDPAGVQASRRMTALLSGSSPESRAGLPHEAAIIDAVA